MAPRTSVIPEIPAKFPGKRCFFLHMEIFFDKLVDFVSVRPPFLATRQGAAPVPVPTGLVAVFLSGSKAVQPIHIARVAQG